MIRQLLKIILKLYLRSPCNSKKCLVYVSCSEACSKKIKQNQKIYNLEEKAYAYVSAGLIFIVENTICAVVATVFGGIVIVLVVVILNVFT